MWHVSFGRGMYAGFWLGNFKARYYLGDLDIDLRIILKCVLNGMGCMDWINLAVYQDKRQTVLNVVMNLQCCISLCIVLYCIILYNLSN